MGDPPVLFRQLYAQNSVVSIRAAAFQNVVLIGWIGHGGKDADNGQGDQQFQQREAPGACVRCHDKYPFSRGNPPSPMPVVLRWLPIVKQCNNLD